MASSMGDTALQSKYRSRPLCHGRPACRRATAPRLPTATRSDVAPRQSRNAVDGNAAMNRASLIHLGTGVLAVLAATPAAAQQQVTAICSTDQSWCELAAKEFQAQTGIKVLQARKATGEAFAQIRAEAANPKTDLWWGGTGDPYLQAAELGLLDAY